ncbi:hypothetical protein ACIRN4_06260 [Pimelobacter simplex]|uniref:hypothetical protein n=1 Tax=Nocardioides simplex TaxID=2045 RepID=UPI00380E7780
MMNSEARKRAAGIAASVPTPQEPASTLVDAPGADSEDLAALIATTVADITYSVSAELILGSSWLADHDRQTAERAWFEGARAEYDFERGEANDIPVNPYSREARRG